MRDVYNEEWYLDVTAPDSRIWRSGDSRFSYQLVDGKAVNPYGYAGILGDPQEVREAFRMPLFIRHAVDYRASGDGVIERATRAIPLDNPWPAGSPHLSESARAGRIGISATKHGADRDALLTFKEGYMEAMKAKNAAPKYYAIGERLEEWAGNPQVHVVLAPGAGAIFLTGDTWAHYHLSFRRPTAHNTAMHAIFDVAVPLCAQAGCQFMHLGGGTTASTDDPLYKFKARIGRMAHTVYFQEVK